MSALILRRRSTFVLALVITVELVAASGAEAFANGGDAPGRVQLEPVVLGWPEFEPVQAANDPRSTGGYRNVPWRQSGGPAVSPDAPEPQAANLGSLARTVTRQLPAEGEFDRTLEAVGGTEPWIIPAAQSDRPPARQEAAPRSVDVAEVAAESANLQPAIPPQPYFGGDPQYAVTCPEECWTHQWMPDGLMFKSFLAGEKEPRFASVWLHDPDRGMIWETALGARLGIWRYGTQGAINPNGWQLDLEGGALTRLDPEEETDVDAADFVIGILMTRRIGPTAIEFGYGHLSSHVGDEYLIKHPTFQRINYVRDSLLFGLAYDVTPDVRVYGEVAYAPGAEDGAKPFEAQFGAEYSPARPYCAPFAAVNFHYREEFGFQFSTNIESGLQVRSPTTNRLFRIGVQHYNGKSLQYEFLDVYETLTGAGMWVDF